LLLIKCVINNRRWRKVVNPIIPTTKSSSWLARTSAFRCCRRWAGRRERVLARRVRALRIPSTSKSYFWFLCCLHKQ